MKNRNIASVAVVATLLLGVVSAMAQDRPTKPRTAATRKKVLVELYTSQGCDSCPPASEFLGQLEALGYGPDRVVPIGFHVDYFNKPWADPFSDAAFSRRQLEYNEVQKRDDLYFTPMMMVDGREPMLGSNRDKATAAIEHALNKAPGLSLDTKLSGEGASKTLSVDLSRPTIEASGRGLIVGVAVVEGPITTKVPSGENAGKSLVEHFVVQSFAHKPAKVARGDSTSLSFPLKLKAGQDAGRTRVSSFVQDQSNGVIYQADSVAWDLATGATPAPIKRK